MARENYEIRIPPMPDLESISPHRCRRVWRLGLEELITTPENLSSMAEEISQEIRSLVGESLDLRYPKRNLHVQQDDFVLRFELANPELLLAGITTGRYSLTDEAILLVPCWLFMRVEQKVGRIKLVQG